MTAVKPSRSCPECRYSGSPGVHWVEPDDPREQPYSVPCPNAAAADAQTLAQKITADAHAEAFRAAKTILTDAAHQYAEFNGNSVRGEMEDARVPSGVVGAAFSWAQREGLIESTGRFVQSSEATTRHRIAVWRSRVYGQRREAS